MLSPVTYVKAFNNKYKNRFPLDLFWVFNGSDACYVNYSINFILDQM